MQLHNSAVYTRASVHIASCAAALLRLSAGLAYAYSTAPADSPVRLSSKAEGKRGESEDAPQNQ
ncbi:hypothetical protein BD311DRAFT_752151 [Dichomitus squalens]|uniref:Uncharacterized protein n=1 Tax=Dichomitus squalens TaxID=114155 RepID=A0A4Q9MYH4_9APHY|nr:hypothetical protein BD311DRAFT_752151 [Dichomitus squalens]